MSPIVQTHTDELRKAGTRIQAQRGQYGGSRPAAVAWLLTFLQEEAAAYSFGEFTNRWWEVLRFCRDAGLEQDDDPLSNLRTVTRQLPGRLGSSLDAIRTYPGPWDREWLQGVQGGWLAILKHYIAEGKVRSDEIRLSFILERGSSGLVTTVPDDGSAFTYQVMHLLAEFGPRIRQCRHCGRMCLAGRSDKAFCSATCQAKQYKIDHPKGLQTAPLKKGRIRHGAQR